MKQAKVAIEVRDRLSEERTTATVVRGKVTGAGVVLVDHAAVDFTWFEPAVGWHEAVLQAWEIAYRQGYCDGVAAAKAGRL